MNIVYHTVVILTILGLGILIPAVIGGNLNKWSYSTFKQDWIDGAIAIGAFLLAIAVAVVISISFNQVFK